ncbi:MAG: TetR/AcrR family transcriptional regulator [Treponema sp.]|nr:TetR/AcrR family transcriptional regulator [Spirochaetia bacterium]MDD7579699.1 TetR/AcrR family transcriptional regulator [Treponema sp.]MCI7441038.1 TetR/AcrR family transcriptional regulator [Spirochaetia bacterium]MDY3759091.1 TetR/AcrR family transcriptional regulator [Treponema sp.]MDY4130521.1 TetR/AcrR family transcriptional regulator [Treponema sp.]
MAIVVEHEKRKRDILEKAFTMFLEEGYEDITYQKIADRCGITRTTLYVYFKNKKDIFLWSIKQLTSDIEKELLSIIKNPELTASDCLKQILFKLFDIAENNQVFFKVLLNYLVQLEKSGADVNERVTRRVIRIQHLMNTVIIRGQKAGQLKHFSVKDINDQLYMIIEDAMFRLGVLNQKSLDQSRSIAEFTVNQIKA